MVRTWSWVSTFDSLRNRPFRWLWLGGLASSATFQMGTVAQGWLVYELTGSAFALGWVSAGWSISTLALSLYGGVMCDRLEKRGILVWSRLAMVFNSLILAVVISLGWVQVWHLAVSSLIIGALFAFLMPAQQTIITELVDDKTLLNANSLNSVGMGLMGIVSSWLAGLLIEYYGVDAVYYVMGAMYALALYTTTKLPLSPGRGDCGGSVWADLRMGVTYIVRHPAILMLLVLGLSRVLLSMQYRTLMPKYAKDVVNLDAAGLGLLMAAPGVGALLISLAIAALGDFRRKGLLYLINGFAMGIGLVVFGLVPVLWVALAALAVVGAASQACMVATQTLLLANSTAEYRGRVMSVYMMSYGLTPLGTIPSGALADTLGVPIVLVGQGALLVGSFGLARVVRPRLHEME